MQSKSHHKPQIEFFLNIIQAALDAQSDSLTKDMPEHLKELVDFLLTNSAKFATIFVDSNPDNRQQLNDFLEDNEDELIALSLALLMFFIEKKVENPILRKYIEANLLATGEVVSNHLIAQG